MRALGPIHALIKSEAVPLISDMSTSAINTQILASSTSTPAMASSLTGTLPITATQVSIIDFTCNSSKRIPSRDDEPN